MSKTEQKRNAYEDSDCQQQIDAIEALEAEKASIMAEAAGRCSGIAKRIQNEIKTAKALGIPTKSFKAMLKVRKLERKIADAAADVPEDEVELFADMSGQFSFLKPEGDEKPAEATPASRAARKATAAAMANAEAKQIEGAAVLDGLAGQTEAVH